MNQWEDGSESDKISSERASNHSKDESVPDADDVESAAAEADAEEEANPKP
jgi:hypothetical protein